MNKNIKDIVIVGGGISGWMTALSLSKETDLDVTLLENPSIGPLGVGNGTIVGIRDYINDLLDMPINEWLPKVNGTFKSGIKFEDFYKKDDYFTYTFEAAVLEDSLRLWHNNFKNKNDYGNYFYPSSKFMLDNKLLIDVPPTKGYADEKIKQSHLTYHLDNNLFIKLLKEKAIEHGTRYVEGEILDVNKEAFGNITSIVIDNPDIGPGPLTGDFFVDCTGFNSRLLNDELDVKYKSFERELINNKTITTTVNYNDKKKDLHPYTKCKALKNGWVWHIPLYDSLSLGYVYSDKFTTDKEAEEEFKNYIKKEFNTLRKFRSVSFKTGYYTEHIKNNVMAVGLSGGFVEPLESTGIFLSCIATEYLKTYLQTKTFRLSDRKIINQRMNSLYEEVKDFLMCHYTLSSRKDTEYWRYVTNFELSDEVLKILELVQHNLKLDATDIDDRRIFPKYGWMSIAIGMNVFLNENNKLYSTKSDNVKYEQLLLLNEQIDKDMTTAYNHLEYLDKYFYN